MEEKIGVLDRAASIAAESLKKIEAPAKAKAAEESKVASEEKAKADELKKKDEGTKLAQAEAKAKEDERILAGDDTKLSDTEKKRKTELMEIKKKKDDSPDEKIKRVQESTQKRIDEIKSELLAKESKSEAKISTLEAELAELKKPKQQEDINAKVKREQAEVQAKYLEEDKTKPKEDRREMSREELDGWYLEDPVSATEWMQERTFRRNEELKKAREAAEKPVDNTEEKKRLAKEFIDKQNESKAKLIAKFPGTLPSKETIAEVKKTLGLSLTERLTDADMTKVRSELCKNEEFRLATEIVAEDPKKYLESMNGPELVMAEIEKRMNKPKGKIELTQEELDAKVEEELERRRRIDGEGITSTGRGKNVNEKNKNKGSLTAEQERVASKSKIGSENYEKMLKRRDSISGAGQGADDKD